MPINIRQRIIMHADALFVVSAGNDPTGGHAVCESIRPYPAYPVCEGNRRNVLVVAATPLDGQALIDQQGSTPGSNWNDRLVHVAAPGTGFYAQGRDNSYVPVHGTSFATPFHFVLLPGSYCSCKSLEKFKRYVKPKTMKSFGFRPHLNLTRRISLGQQEIRASSDQKTATETAHSHL